MIAPKLNQAIVLFLLIGGCKPEAAVFCCFLLRRCDFYGERHCIHTPSDKIRWNLQHTKKAATNRKYLLPTVLRVSSQVYFASRDMIWDDSLRTRIETRPKWVVSSPVVSLFVLGYFSPLGLGELLSVSVCFMILFFEWCWLVAHVRINSITYL